MNNELSKELTVYMALGAYTLEPVSGSAEIKYRQLRRDGIACGFLNVRVSGIEYSCSKCAYCNIDLEAAVEHLIEHDQLQVDIRA
jgi:hypothetical protein